MNPHDIARIAHEANRALCATHGDHSQLPWDEAPEWQRASVLNGVIHKLDNPHAEASESHANWLALKTAEGWTYGPQKDPATKTHPCMVPYDQLPPHQRIKDSLFCAIVEALVNRQGR